ncbi:hypothetical protein K469DRAFT_709596 [Zopfia rhizophila CBS 207.26]|uniref:Uncharacterized protein n=1 Tax=Zopfia rhizophila CBS 207.26 TaxID=1314779 RepID=A0A6A6ETI5_9PEZI|nr:hypothetical protein K469DRAFT_709596 [Zopfia rhizophila CBS 207.26]
MQLQQKRTFLPYLRGVTPEALRLGSLYLNPLEPNDGLASKRFEYRRDIEDQREYEIYVKKWTWKEESDRPFSIDFETSQSGSLGMSFSEWLSVKGERNKATMVTLEGESGRRLKIRDPEMFLCDQVMQQDGAERWIMMHASIAHRGLFGRNRWKVPEIWMVTGVQHVTGGEVHFEGSASSKISGYGGGDLGPAVGAPPGVAKIKGEASRENSNGAKNDFGHEDERVWAAQFMQVVVEFGAQEDAENKSHPKFIREFRLQDIPDLKAQGIRASEEQGNQPAHPPPKLIGRISAQPSKPESYLNDPNAEDPEGIIIDDTPYVESIQDANWKMYDECSKYLIAAERRRDLVNREQDSQAEAEP